ncbi:GAF domain-containing sensor histidine kinase [Candidatus Daviesbacteria bacterium]|nr:GAF domain-containing sensor histidine kinase [Candidatus Daviesbacteria bacterium]
MKKSRPSYKEAPIPPNEKVRLKSLKSLNILDSPKEERFDRITRLALELFNIPIATVTLVDEHREWFKSSQGLTKREGARSISFCGHAILQEDILVIADTKKDPRFANNPMVTGSPFIGFYAGVPIRSADGQHIGVFCIKDHRPRNLDKKKRAWLKTLASWVELEINATELSRALEARKQAEQKISNLNDALKVLNKILRHDVLNELTMVRMALELCFKNVVSKKETLQDALDAVDRSAELIKQIGQLEAAISNGVSFKPYRVASVVKKVSGQFPSIKIKLKGDGVVLADDAFVSVVQNLLRNAAVHAKTDRVDITIEEKKGFTLISIADYGRGIPAHIKGKIFTEGVKFGVSGHMGLGLFIVKKTIERYGGTILTEDNKPNGTKFLIRLPKL